MTIDIPADVEAYIRQMVESGRFDNAHSAMREALRLLQVHDQKLQRLRSELQIGLDQEANDELIDWTPDFIERVKLEADERSRLGLPVRDAVKP